MISRRKFLKWLGLAPAAPAVLESGLRSVEVEQSYRTIHGPIQIEVDEVCHRHFQMEGLGSYQLKAETGLLHKYVYQVPPGGKVVTYD